jgi:DNA-directed RNA polymerase specialized sigma24 family protein
VENRLRLRRALAARLPLCDIPDAVSSALTYALEHWDRVSAMDYPVAYLYRVGLSKSRRRREGFLVPEAPDDDIGVEPALIQALHALPRRQREMLWLVDACGWRLTDAAHALKISPSTAGTHRSRGLRALRNALGVDQ